MEYGLPFVLLFAAGVQANCVSPGKKWRVTALYADILIYCLILSGTTAYFLHYARFRGFRPAEGFAQYTESRKIPRNTQIANLIWSDFPLLFYAAPDMRYSTGLDPMFSYSVFPDKMKKIEKFRRRMIVLSPAELADITGADYAFIGYRYRQFISYLKRLGYKCVYQGEDGALFLLKNMKKESRQNTPVIRK